MFNAVAAYATAYGWPAGLAIGVLLAAYMVGPRMFRDWCDYRLDRAALDKSDPELLEHLAKLVEAQRQNGGQSPALDGVPRPRRRPRKRSTDGRM